MKIYYEMITESERQPISYGIAAYAEGVEGRASSPIAFVGDISTERDAVLALVQLCNRLELSVLHLHDVVEDFLLRQ